MYVIVFKKQKISICRILYRKKTLAEKLGKSK